MLPSFATCPDTIDDLVLVHGSRNRIEAAGGPNLMFALDQMIRDNLSEPRHRLHQLWLTGDQVYADEVAATLSVVLNVVGRELIGADELLDMPVDAALLGVPVHQQNFPGGYRKRLMNDVARS